MQGELLNTVITKHSQLPTNAAALGQQFVQVTSSQETYAKNTLNSFSFLELHHIQEPLFNYYIELNTREGCNTLLKIMQLNRWYLFAVGSFISTPIVDQFSSSAETVIKWIQVLRNNNADLLLDCFRSPLQQTLIQYFHTKRNLNIPAFLLFANVFESHLELLKSLVCADIFNLNKLLDIEGKFAIISLDEYAKVLKLNFSSPCSSYVLAHVLKDTIVYLINHRRLLYSLPSHFDCNLNVVSQINLIFISFLKENKFFDLGSDILHSYLDYLWLNLLSIINHTLDTQEENNQKNQCNHVFAFDGFISLIKNEVIDQSNFELVGFVEYALEGIIYEGDDEELLRHGFEFMIIKFPKLRSPITKKIIQALEDNLESNLPVGALCTVFDHILEKNLIDQALSTELQLVQKVIGILSRNEICDSEEQMRALWVLDTLAEKDFFNKSLVDFDFVQTVTSIDLFSCENNYQFVQQLFTCLIKKSLITKLELATYIEQCFYSSSWRVKANVLWLFSGEEEKSFMDKCILYEFGLLPKFLESLADYHSNFESKTELSQLGFLTQAIQFIESIVDNGWIDQSSVVSLQLVDKLLALLSSDAAGPAFVWLTKLLDNDLIDKSWFVTKPELVKKITAHLVTIDYPYHVNKSVSPKGVLAFAEMVRECFKRSDAC